MYACTIVVCVLYFFPMCKMWLLMHMFKKRGRGGHPSNASVYFSSINNFCVCELITYVHADILLVNSITLIYSSHILPHAVSTLIAYYTSRAKSVYLRIGLLSRLLIYYSNYTHLPDILDIQLYISCFSHSFIRCI